MKNLIESTLIIGKFKGMDMLIPRIPLMLTEFAFEFMHIQFPVSLAFSMSINKFQGQSLEVCGINLHCRVFCMGSCMQRAQESANHRRYLLSLHMEKLKILYTISHYNKVSTYDQIFILIVILFLNGRLCLIFFIRYTTCAKPGRAASI